MADAKSVWSWRKIVESSAEFYIDSMACVWVGNDMSEWFQINVGLRHGRVMSPWLLSPWLDVSMDVSNHIWMVWFER